MIQGIEIENFRSIENLNLDSVNAVNVITGPNSAGKTNLLKALNILLGETYPTERAFKRDDFFDRDTNRTIKIRVTFSEILGTFRLTASPSNQKVYCRPNILELTHTKNPNETFRTKFFAYDSQGNKFYANGDVREAFSFVYLPSEREISKQLGTSQWSVFGKVLTQINENFTFLEEGSEPPNSRVRRFERAIEEPRNILEESFENDLVSFLDFKESFQESCEKFLGGLSDSVELDLEIYDPLYYYKTVQVVGNETERKFAYSEMGTGAQNLILLSLMRSYAMLFKKKAILAIEEPETFLFPQAQRHLYKQLRLLSEAETGVQIFYTTHNQNFVRADKSHEIITLFKNSYGKTVQKEKNPIITKEFLEDEAYKIYAHFNLERNEIFFAQKILLVEGKADKILFDTLLPKWGVDTDALGYSVIECGGKGGVIYFIGVCRLLGLDYFAVWDSDDDVTDQFHNLAYSLEQGRGFEIPVNIEELLGIQLNADKSDKIEKSFTWANQETNIEIANNKLSSIRDFFTVDEATETINDDTVPF